MSRRSIYNLEVSTAASGYSGFFDVNNQIVVVPSMDIPLEVVVDHEISHVNITRRSALGLLEQIAHSVERSARANFTASDNEASEILATIYRNTEIVHEAAAWFGTELQTARFENLKAPLPYRSRVNALHQLFQQKNWGFLDIGTSAVQAQMEIADALAIYALDVPAIQDFWGGKLELSSKTLQEVLADPVNNPTARFDILLAMAETWSEAQLRQYHQTDGDTLELERAVPRVKKKNLPFAGNVRIYEQLAQVCGVADLPERIGITPLEWYRYVMWLEAIDVSVDTYAQVCVVQRELPYEPGRTFIGGEPPDLLLATPYYIVATDALPSNELKRDVLGHGLAYVEGISLGMRFRWIAKIERVRDFLLNAATIEKPLIAVSSNYAFGKADFQTGPMLEDIPHIVIALLDVRGFCIRITASIESMAFGKGIAGSTELTVQVWSSLKYESVLSYIVIRPLSSDHPVIILPIIAKRASRVVSYLVATAKAGGIAVNFSSGNHGLWAGSAYASILAAIRLFER